MPRRPPALEEELVEKILLRLHPNWPPGLFRAALVCKRWCRLISSPAFRRRYREFHRTPPLVGVLTNGVAADDPGGSRHESRYVHNESRWSTYFVHRDLRALDARHGRLLLQWIEDEEDAHYFWAKVALIDRAFFQRVGAALEGARGLIVRVPVVTNERRDMSIPIPSEGLRTLAAAVLCSDTTGACDHLDCQRGPFLVVLVVCRSDNILIYTYSSETATWSDPISIKRQHYIAPARLMPSAYVRNALYFGFRSLLSILKYDLQLGRTSWIPLPSLCSYHQPNVLTTTEAGKLGLATMRHSKIYIWSRNDAPPEEDDTGWRRTIVIELGRPAEALLPSREPHVLGSTDDPGIIFFWAYGVVYGIDVKTLKWSKLFGARTVYTLICYRSFDTPALEAACRDEGPSDGGSSA